MKQICLSLIIAILLLLGCGADNKKESKLSTPYTLISEEPWQGISKCNLNIGLPSKYSKAEIEAIGKELHEARSKYEKLYIFYHLTTINKDIEKGAWAFTHYTPDLEVNILGATIEEEKAMKDVVNNLNGNIVGKWFSEKGTNGLAFALEDKKGKYIFHCVYKNLQHTESPAAKTGNRIEDEMFKLHGQYYIIERNGDLGLYNKEAKQWGLGVKF